MPAKTVLAISGALGFVVVAFGYPDWQVAVETAQVLAGIVHYPAGNPFYIYHLKLWTILHQVCAIALAAGIGEIAVSIALSGVLGMVAFQALAMTVYALSRDGVLAVTAVVAIVASNTANIGVGYPIYLLGSSHTYGALGLAVVVLVAALFGSGEHRLAAFLLGLAPAIHPSLGIWLAIVVGCSLLMDRPHARAIAGTSWRFFAAGCAVTAVSLAVHLLMSRGVPAVPSSVASSYLSAFTAFWDGHRQPVPFDHLGVRLTLGSLALASIALYVLGNGDTHRFRSTAPETVGVPSSDARFFLRFIAISAVVGVLAVWASSIPPSRLPQLLVILMPTRLLNVTSATFAALVMGLLGSYGRWWWGRWGTVLFAVLLLAGQRSMLWEWVRARGWDVQPAPIGSIAVLIIFAAALVAGGVLVRVRHRDTGEPVAAPCAAAGLAQLATAMIVVWIAAGPALAEDERATVLRDRTNDVLLGAAAHGRGLLLTGGDLRLIQLRTRRPVLLDGGSLDGLAYAEDAAPAMDRILREVYDINLFGPPDEARRRGAVPPEYNRRRWQQYPSERWVEIKRKYNVTQVLVPSDWQLALPIAAQSRRFLLYDIP